MADTTPITLVFGDGIGPTLMDAALLVAREAGAEFRFETATMGGSVYKTGDACGISSAAWESIARTQCLLKAPTQQATGSQHCISTQLHQRLGLHTSIRAFRSPVGQCPALNMLLVGIGHNEHYLPLHSQPCAHTTHQLYVAPHALLEAGLRHAYTQALQQHHTTFHCCTHQLWLQKLCDRIAKEYPTITTHHTTPEAIAHTLHTAPETLQTVVALHADAAWIANIAHATRPCPTALAHAWLGTHGALYTTLQDAATHHAAPQQHDPSSMIMAMVWLLCHSGQPKVAARMHTALLAAQADGLDATSLGAAAFAEALCERFYARPDGVALPEYTAAATATPLATPAAHSMLAGYDFWLAAPLSDASLAALNAEARFAWQPLPTVPMHAAHGYRALLPEATEINTTNSHLLHALQLLAAQNAQCIKTEALHYYDGKAGF